MTKLGLTTLILLASLTPVQAKTSAEIGISALYHSVEHGLTVAAVESLGPLNPTQQATAAYIIKLLGSADAYAMGSLKGDLKNLGTALEMWASDHTKAYPARIDQLAPDYLLQIPVDPFSRAPFQYTTTNNRYALSVTEEPTAWGLKAPSYNSEQGLSGVPNPVETGARLVSWEVRPSDYPAGDDTVYITETTQWNAAPAARVGCMFKGVVDPATHSWKPTQARTIVQANLDFRGSLLAVLMDTIYATDEKLGFWADRDAVERLLETRRLVQRNGLAATALQLHEFLLQSALQPLFQKVVEQLKAQTKPAT